MSDDTDFDTHVEVKVTDPFASLEKSSMNLMNCKQNYQNMRQNGQKFFDLTTTENFWNSFDKDGFSIHFGAYTDNGGLGGMNSIGDMIACNRTTGLKNQLDDNGLSHKHSMGMFKLLYGTDSKEIVCVFITRGQTMLSEVFSDILDSFTWTAVDSTDLAVRQRVSDMFHTDEGDSFDGKTVKKNVLYL